MDQALEINFEEFQNLLQEYETVINDLTVEVDFYKCEYTSIKSQISLLAHDNTELSTKLKESLNLTQDNKTEHKYSENDIIINLKNQLNTLAKEKQSVVQLWQSSLQTIDYLEEELKLFEGRTHGYISKNELQNIRKSYNEQKQIQEGKSRKLEEKIVELQQKLDKIKEENERTLENHKHISQFVKELESENKSLKEKYNLLEKQQYALEIELKFKQKQIDDLQILEQQSKDKVREAINVVESALLEKDSAILRESQAKDQVIQLKKSLADITEEEKEKIKNEIATVKKEYEEKYKNNEGELKKVQEQLKDKCFEYEVLMVKYESLNREISTMQKGNFQVEDSNMSKLLILEKNLEATFQKLLNSEKKNLQLTSERDNIKMDLEQMSEHFKRDIAAREVEKRSLTHKISLLQKELDVSSCKLLKITDKMNKLETKWVQIKQSYRKEKMLYDKAMEGTEIELKSCNAEIDGLLKLLEMQIALNKKWKTEALKMHEKLTAKINDLRTKLNKLSLINSDLDKKLMLTQKEITKYEEIVKNMYSNKEKE